MGKKNRNGEEFGAFDLSNEEMEALEAGNEVVAEPVVEEPVVKKPEPVKKEQPVTPTFKPEKVVLPNTKAPEVIEVVTNPMPKKEAEINPGIAITNGLYPDASYVFEVSGNNGKQILPGQSYTSPNSRMIIPMKYLKDVCTRGFYLRWFNKNYADSEWYGQLITTYNVDNFAAFILSEIESGRLSLYYFGS